MNHKINMRKRAISIILTLAMLISMVPGMAFAETAAGAAGTRTEGSYMVPVKGSEGPDFKNYGKNEPKPDPQPEEPDVREAMSDVKLGNESEVAYNVTAKVTVKDNKISDVVLTHTADISVNHSSSAPYADKAKVVANSLKGLSITDKAAIEGVDTVTGATITSNAYRDAVLKALGLYTEPAPAAFTFGSANTNLKPGIYKVPVSLRNAGKHGTPSNAATAFPAMVDLIIAEDGTATITSDFKSVTIGPITDMAYDVKIYQKDSFQTGTPLADAKVNSTMVKPEPMPGAGKTVPVNISFNVPNNEWDGVYMQFTVDAMGPSSPDAWLSIDYANAKAPGRAEQFTGEAKVNQFGKYTIIANVTVQDGVISNVAVSAKDFISETHKPTNEMKIDQVTKALKSAWNGMAPTQENAESIFRKIMNPQKPDEVIDSVSGATYSAKAVRDAVMNAFKLEYQDEVINVPENVAPGVYEVEVEYASDVVWHSLVENAKTKAKLTVNSDKTMSLDMELKSGTDKEPLYILGFNGVYPDNDRSQELTMDGCKTAMGLSSNDYSDENFAKGTQVVNHVTFPLLGGLNRVYNTNAYIYVPAMKRLNGELSGVFFENGKFNADIFAKIYWDGMKKIGKVTGGGSVPGTKPELKPEVEENPEGKKDVVVEIPKKDLKPGEVAVIVKPDGTKEVIKKSVADEAGLKVLLDGNAKIEIVDNSKSFNDVADNYWAKEAVSFVTSREIFNGTGNGAFAPEESMTRGMLVKVLHNFENNPESAAAENFGDVAGDEWYADSVKWAAGNGIVSGIGNGSFAPNDEVTREQLAVILYRYAGSPAVNGDLAKFKDASKVSSYAQDAMIWAVESGLINGMGNNELNPQGSATRAQVAVIMMRLCDMIVK